MTTAPVPQNMGKAQWSVVSQMPATRPGAGGRFEAGTTITFRTTSGAEGNVFVPNSVLNVETARRMIAAKAATLEGIAGLTS